MVQIIEADNSWADAARKFGSDLVQGYANRSDEQAIQKSIMALGDKPTARQILDALTNTKTHSPKAKQEALKNYMGVAEFEEAQAKNKEAQKVAEARATIEENKAANTKAYQEGRLATEGTRAQAATDRATTASEHKNKQLEEQTRHNKAVEGTAATAQGTQQQRVDIEAKREEEKAQAKLDEQEQSDAIIDQIPDKFMTPEMKAGLKGSLSKDQAETLLRDSLEPPKATLEDKEFAKRRVKETGQLTSNIIDNRKVREEVGKLRKLSDTLSTFEARTTGWTQFNKTANDLSTRSFPLIKTVLELIAGKGTIALGKIKIAEEKHAINKTDSVTLRNSKLDALDSLAQIAIERDQEKLNLLKLGSNQAILDKFDSESSSIVDAYMDMDLDGEEVFSDELPPAIEEKGFTGTLSDGTKVKSDGVRWTKIL